MMKSGLALLLLGVAFWFGLTLPGPSSRDRVPDSQKVAHSIHCEGCHGYDETGQALVDHQGNDVNIFEDWQYSMMGLSARDPFWRATLNHEVNLFPAAKSAIEATCLRCHAPLGSIQSGLDGWTYSYAAMLQDTLGLDGVSCSACHQQPAENLGKGHSGHFNVDTNRVFFGHLPDPFAGPMQIYVGFEPKFSDHIYQSGICAGCHTLITETLDDEGLPTGHFFTEQATYHEWLNSSYPAQGKECQSCHIPFISDGVIIATDFLALEERQPYGLHQFFGANTAMLSLMRDHADSLSIPKSRTPDVWEESISNNRQSLSKAAKMTIESVNVISDTLYIETSIRNLAGHKLPSGYPNRMAWIEVVLTDQESADTLYANGLLNSSGDITGRDDPFEPHHEVAYSAGDVQIYEMVMRDSDGQLTTRLNSAFAPLKDNRILPSGFTHEHSVYDTVAIWGNVQTDMDYTQMSSSGRDRISYHIPLHGKKGLAHLKLALRYQSIPPRWMKDLFAHDTLPAVASFKSMYGHYSHFLETIDSVEMTDVDLTKTSWADRYPELQIDVFPNPLRNETLHVTVNGLPDHLSITDYTLWSADGRPLQQGKYFADGIPVSNVPNGLTYLALYSGQQLISIKPFIRL